MGDTQMGDQGLKTLRLIKFSALENTTVKNLEDKDIGHVDELVIDPQTGEVRYAALSFGGLGEMGDKKFAIPLDALDIQSEDRIIFNVTKEQLEEAEGFEKDNWPTHASTHWAGYRSSGRTSDVHVRQPSHLDKGVGAPEGSQAGIMPVKKSSELVGMKVQNRQEEDLGSIKELYIDPDRCRLVYAAMAHGGVLGIGDKLFAVPWESFQTDKKDMLILDIPKTRLDDAPYAAAAEHDTWYDPAWVVTVYNFYQVAPYWTTATGQGTIRERDMDKPRDMEREHPDKDE
jgi:sporulation protein YlmC with PRC-barrel domain